MNKILNFIKQRFQLIVNIYLFINITIYIIYQIYQLWMAGNLNFVEISFIVQNIILVIFILLRHNHQVINKNIFHQLVALIAFFSGIAFIGQKPSGGETARLVSTILILSANILGMFTLLNLGRSFGILIALRKVKTDYIYSIIRHPMYLSDILLRIGFLISHFNLFTIAMTVLSSACYVYRAQLEEQFLSQDKAYQEYCLRVKYRFIPFVY